MQLTTDEFPVRMAVVGLVAITIGAIAALVIASRQDPQEEPPAAAATPAQPAEAASPVIEPAKAPATSPSSSPSAPLPRMELDARMIDKFQDAQSRAGERLLAGGTGMSYTLAAAAALREGIAGLGCDPDQTLLHWLSRDFSKSMLQGNPAEATDRIRFVENSLSVALGDGTSEEEFSNVISIWSPDVQAQARLRRAKMTQ